jgi:hypothetical protein
MYVRVCVCVCVLLVFVCVLCVCSVCCLLCVCVCIRYRIPMFVTWLQRRNIPIYPTQRSVTELLKVFVLSRVHSKLEQDCRSCL